MLWWNGSHRLSLLPLPRRHRISYPPLLRSSPTRLLQPRRSLPLCRCPSLQRRMALRSDGGRRAVRQRGGVSDKRGWHRLSGVAFVWGEGWSLSVVGGVGRGVGRLVVWGDEWWGCLWEWGGVWGEGGREWLQGVA